ncbi:MAG: hypothetical protein LBS97_00595 [Treponema sp.]|jgi:hypothetical protein|nr:hypothetical protein [Treponema sp.]
MNVTLWVTPHHIGAIGTDLRKPEVAEHLSKTTRTFLSHLIRKAGKIADFRREECEHISDTSNAVSEYLVEKEYV